MAVGRRFERLWPGRRVESAPAGPRGPGATGWLGRFGLAGGWAAAEVAVAEAVAVAPEAEDFGVVDEPVDHRGCDDLVAEDLAPGGEGFVAGDDQRGALVAGTDEREHQVGGLRVEGDVADLVNDEQRCPEQPAQLFVEASLPLRVAEPGDPFGRGREGWYLTGTKHGVSALGLQRLLGLGSYETSWTLLHKLRRAMVRPGRERLAGEVEVDETFVGPPAPGGYGRGSEKPIIAIAVEIRRRGSCGRARLARLKDCSEPSLSGFITEAAEPGSVIYSDGWQGYRGIQEAGFHHHRTSLAASGDPAHIVMPRVHRVASLLKRWLLGTHQGAVRPQQLDYYLGEFTFRFNRRTSQHRGLLFYRLLEQAMQVDPAPVAAIIGGRP